MKPWAGYVRVSFVGGRSGDSFRSVDDQTKVIEDWAARRGAPLIMLPPELDGKGNDPQRVVLRQAVAGVEAGTYAGIVVAYLSRAGRDLRLLLDLWHEVEGAGGTVMCATENIDTTTIEGRLVRNILASIAQAERERLAHSFEQQARSATERGIWQRRQTPTGYRKDPDTRRLVIEPGEAAKVRRAFRDHAAGKPIVRIAEDLGLTPSGVRHLLSNRVYLGELRSRSHVNEAAHPAIVTPEEFEAVQGTRAVRRPRSARPPALLAGLVRCAGCGHVMSRTSGGRGRDVYGCSPHKSLGRCPEPASITLRLLDEHLERIAVQEIAAHAARASEATDTADTLRREVDEARRDLATFLEVTASAGLDADTLAAGVRQRKERLDTAEDELRRHSVGQAIPVVDDPQALWDEMSHEVRGQLLRGLVEAVVVKKVGRGRVVPVGERTRVLRHGAGVFEAKAGSEVATPLRRVWPLLDDPAVLRVGR